MSSPLVLSTYKPNFADPRVKARVQKVLEFCKPMLVQKKAGRISSAVLTKTFGNQKSDLSARLRYKLLQQEGTYAPGKNSFSYTLKRDGYAELAAAIGQQVLSDTDTAQELYGAIADGLDVPKYSERTVGLRRYSGFQNLPKVMRAVLFNGWFDYDIEGAAPTLVYQLACRVHRKLYPAKTGAPYPSVAQLIERKAEVRQHVAEIAGLELSAVKTLLAALFFQAPLVAHHKRATYRIVGFDADVIDRLKADPFVSAFKRDVSVMWSAVLKDDTVNNGLALFRDGKRVPNAESKSKQRMAVYARLERQVMDVMESVLAADGMVPLLMHDGFMVRTRADANRLIEAVQENTGFVIKLSESQIGRAEPIVDEGDESDVLDLLEGD